MEFENKRDNPKRLARASCIVHVGNGSFITEPRTQTKKTNTMSAETKQGGSRYRYKYKEGDPLVEILMDAISVIDKPLTRIAGLIDADRSVIYSWVKGVSRPAVTNLIKLAILAGGITSEELDSESGELKTRRWWIEKMMRLRGGEIPADKLSRILEAFSGDALASGALAAIGPIERRRLLTSCLGLFKEGDDLYHIERCPAAADHIIASQALAQRAPERERAWREGDGGEIMYLFAGNDLLVGDLYKWIHSFAERMLNSRQVMTVFLAPMDRLSHDEFNLLKDLYGFWLKRLPLTHKGRVRVFLSRAPVRCPVGVSACVAAENKIEYSWLHGLEDASRALLALYGAKGQEDGVHEKIYHMATIRTDMSKGAAETLLNANGIRCLDIEDFVSARFRFAPIDDRWFLVSGNDGA